MLRSTGIIAASGAVLAACGSSSASKTIARVGETPEITKLGEVTVTDVVLLRTAMSVETMAKTILTDTAVTSLVAKTQRVSCPELQQRITPCKSSLAHLCSWWRGLRGAK